MALPFLARGRTWLVSRNVGYESVRRCSGQVAQASISPKPDVRKLADLAHLDVTDEEVWFS